jgi:hypothetical protein
MTKRSDTLISVTPKFSACKHSYRFFEEWVCVEVVTYNGTKVLISFHYFAPDIKRDIISRVNSSVLSDVRLVQELLGKHEPQKIRYF